MKNLIVVGISFFAVQSAFACPNLTGDYVNTRRDKLKITHEGNLLNINNSPQSVIVDGQEHNIELDPDSHIVYVASCSNEEQLTIRLNVQIGGESFESADTFTVTATGLHETMTGPQTVEIDWIKQ